MSHYTLNSGVRSATITSRCPICLTVTHYITTAPMLTDEDISCPEHKPIYMKSLWGLWSRAQEWGKEYGLHGVEAFNEYMLHVGK